MAVPSYRELEARGLVGADAIACRQRMLTEDAIRRLEKQKAKCSAQRSAYRLDPDGHVNADWLIDSIWHDVIVARPEFHERSLRIRLAKKLAKAPLHDSHVEARTKWLSLSEAVRLRETLLASGQKPCSKCSEVKPLTEFSGSGRGKYRSSCKECVNAPKRGDPNVLAMAKERRAKALAADPEKFRAQVAKYQGARNAYNERKRREAGARPLEVYKEHLAKSRADAAAAREQDRIRREAELPHQAHVQAWKKANAGEDFKRRYRSDPQFNAKQRLRSHLRKLATLDGRLAANVAGACKGRSAGLAKWWAALGYTVTDLVAHLQSTMPAGSTWDDFLAGRLHIDHKRPRAAFDLTDIEQVRQCWSLGNLQLLTAADNIAKSDRLPCGTSVRVLLRGASKADHLRPDLASVMGEGRS